MGKLMRFVVCGPSGVGKTSLIEQCIYGNYSGKTSEDFISTFEDTYNAVVETDRGSKERIRIHDLGGTSKLERHFVTGADAFILVYDVSDAKSFSAIKILKQEIDSLKEKRDIILAICGHKSDKTKDPRIDTAEVAQWVQLEKACTFETSVHDRQSLLNMFSWIVSRIMQSQSKSGFPFGKKDNKGFLHT